LRSEGEMGLLWYTKKKFKDFVPKLDWKISRRNDNSGVFIRFSYPDNDPLIAVNTGYEMSFRIFLQWMRILTNPSNRVMSLLIQLLYFLFSAYNKTGILSTICNGLEIKLRDTSVKQFRWSACRIS
jgi:3-keto-disaccharide hydrolase